MRHSKIKQPIEVFGVALQRCKFLCNTEIAFLTLLSQTGCLKGWTSQPGTPYCYYVGDNITNQADVSSYCASIYGEVADTKNIRDMALFLRIIMNKIVKNASFLDIKNSLLDLTNPEKAIPLCQRPKCMFLVPICT